jgi:hypothetical protein
MANTTNYNWETPDDTDLVKDGALAIRTLGSSVDTTTKALNPSTTLGDIEYRSSTANTNTRLGIGTAGQILTVNSGATAPEWATPAGGAGLVHIAEQTWSAVSSVNINNIFSSTYTHYKIIMTYSSSAGDSELLMRYRVSGADDTSANYQNQRLIVDAANTPAANRSAGATSNRFAIQNTNENVIQATIFNPFLAARTYYSSEGSYVNAEGTGETRLVIYGGTFRNSTSFTGMTLIPASGTTTGKINVWGFKA